MEDFLINSNFPIFAAFLLGIISTFDPCPLALNITAISYISNDIKKKWEVIVRGTLYTLGRMIVFAILGAIVFFGADSLKLGNLIMEYGEKIIGIIMVIVGIFMLDIIHFHFPFHHKMESMAAENRGRSYINIFLLGALFSLSLCPHTLIYLGMLIPLCISGIHSLIIPASFALGGGIPVMIISFLVAFCISNIANVYSHVRTIEAWMRKITAVIFIIVGLYIIIENFIL